MTNFEAVVVAAEAAGAIDLEGEEAAAAWMGMERPYFAAAAYIIGCSVPASLRFTQSSHPPTNAPSIKT